MNTQGLKEKIIEIFQKNRQSSNSYYNEERFLDYLITPPASKNNIKNTFKGVRRYYRFFDEVEQAFGICFSLSDQDRFYSIDQFVKKTQERIGKGRGNKMIIERRLQQKDHYYIEFILTFILLFVIVWFGIHLITVITVLGYSIAIWWIVGSKRHDKRHNSQLYKKIMENEQNTHNRVDGG